MTVYELRKKYLEFMKKRGHKIMPSASLIPQNDPTTLFTGSGMQPMLPYLLGEKHPLGKRIADSQKSFRAQDIEEVGDDRHTTFFEMLGNWSLGDYFKKEQIEWIFDFLTQELKLDPQRIYVTVFRGESKIGIKRDKETANLWKKQFKKVGIEAKEVDLAEHKGMQGGRIFYYGVEKNWWSRSGTPENMPVGEPGGPDSEIFWDLGKNLKRHEKSKWKNHPCHPNCDCGRFLEIGNNVFMEYIKTEKGFEKLQQKNVDYGGGLERQAVATANVSDIFLIDSFAEAIKKIEELSKRKYAENKKFFQIIADHLRAATFLISDGAYPSNKDQGYFTRRLIRRAIRSAYKLGVKENYCRKIAEVNINYFQKTYPDLAKKRNIIMTEMEKEENRFRKTLEKGLKKFEQLASKNKNITGGEAFNLYQTYGFPLEITKELAYEKSIPVDEKGFQNEFKKHQELSRVASVGKFKGGLADTKEKTTQLHTVTHLMLAGLRKILGEEVHQRGANITDKRIRFDFSYHKKMAEEQKKAVEDFVNKALRAHVSVTMEEMTLKEAKKSGAEGEFSYKYGEKVKVYTIGDPETSSGLAPFSREICGGPHIKNTKEIKGTFRIKKEQSSSAGIRRIKAVVE